MNNNPSDNSVDSNILPASVSDSNISVTTEDGVWVFKKRQESDEEVIFYNTDYFKRIGFPDAEVSIGKVTQDGIMKGGYYKNTEKLTYPFRQFVYLIQQKEGKSVKKEKPIKEGTSETNEQNSNFFERLGNYSVQISKGVQSGVDRISPYFKTNSANLTEAEKQKLQEEDEKNQALRNEEENEKNKAEEDNEKSNNGDFDNDNYWIVRIPIVNDDSLIPKNKYEKEEILNRALQVENRVEKTLGKSKVGKVYEVGSRVIRMCEKVKEYEELKIEANPLKGSIMYKLHSITLTQT